jgi:hypothetical protein
VLAAFLGGYKLKNFFYKLAAGTKGGILLMWDQDRVEVINVNIKRSSVSIDIELKSSNTSFLITIITRDNRKPAFFHELRHL